MRRPSFQFYPGDWRGNAKLRRCSHAERGIWIEVMCLMHDSEEYGLLRWPLKDIAQAVSCKVSELRRLVEKGVLKGAEAGERCEPLIYTPRHARKDGEPVTLLAEQEGPVWCSSRMLVDEYRSVARGASTRFTAAEERSPGATSRAEGDAPGHSPTERQGDGSSSSSSPSVGGGNGASKVQKIHRGTACPDEFEVSDSMAQWAVGVGVAADNLKPQTEKFLDHHRAKGSTFRDWNAAWRTWMRNTVEFEQRRATH